MGRAEFITTEFWDEVENLSPWATLLFIWSWTNAKCNMAGLYRVSRSAMAESKCPRHKIDDAVHELQEAGFVYYEQGVLWVKSRVKHLAPRNRRNSNPKIAAAVAKHVGQIDPDHPLRVAFVDKYGREKWLKTELDKIQREASEEAKSRYPIHTPSKGYVEEEVAEEAEVVAFRKSPSRGL